MCVFKALHMNPSEQHTELSETEFYDFYEVQNLKWREVSIRDGGRAEEGGGGRNGVRGEG